MTQNVNNEPSTDRRKVTRVKSIYLLNVVVKQDSLIKSQKKQATYCLLLLYINSCMATHWKMLKNKHSVSIERCCGVASNAFFICQYNTNFDSAIHNCIHEVSGGARVFAARGKRLCCRSRHQINSGIRVFFSIRTSGVNQPWRVSFFSVPSHSLSSPPFFSQPFPSLIEVVPWIQLSLGERCKLHQWGLGRSPSRNWIWCILALKSDIWLQQYLDQSRILEAQGSRILWYREAMRAGEASRA